MQAYHNGDRVYGYGSKGQSYAPPPQYNQQYPGYGYAQTGGAPIAAPFPMYPGGIQPGTPAPGRPRPLDREPSRSSTPGHARPGLKPLKSALKRTRTPDHGGPVGEVPPLVRGRTPDNVSIQRQRTRSGSRMRVNSTPRWDSGACLHDVLPKASATCSLRSPRCFAAVHERVASRRHQRSRNCQ